MLKQSIFGAHNWAKLLVQTRAYAPRGHHYDHNSHKKVMPGMRRQAKLLQDFDEFLDDPEGFGNHEADFQELNKVHREFERDVVYNDKKIKQIMIKNKYFNEKQRNFLTWAEKEQIRNLHSNNPDEWTLERLAESFPINIGDVGKVAKAKWYPNDAKRVQKHDEAVKKAWESFRKNELTDLDPDYAAHLQKFTDRNFDNSGNNVNYRAMLKTKFELPKPQRTEFRSIITSCPAAKSNERNEEKTISDGRGTSNVPARISNVPARISQKLDLYKSGTPVEGVDDTFLLATVHNKKHYQFDAISKKKAVKQIKKLTPEPVSMNPYQRANESNGAEIIALKTIDFVEPVKKVEKYESRTTANVSFQGNVHPMDAVDVVRRRIRIPRHLYRRGATYQFRDCFYDTTGEFLYRVPGMVH